MFHLYTAIVFGMVRQGSKLAQKCPRDLGPLKISLGPPKLQMCQFYMPDWETTSDFAQQKNIGLGPPELEGLDLLPCLRLVYQGKKKSILYLQ